LRRIAVDVLGSDTVRDSATAPDISAITDHASASASFSRRAMTAHLNEGEIP
jgi:hypothetical protein